LKGGKNSQSRFYEWEAREKRLENRRRVQNPALGANGPQNSFLEQIHADVIHLFDAARCPIPCRGDASSPPPGPYLGRANDGLCSRLSSRSEKRCRCRHADGGTLQSIVVKDIGPNAK